MRVSVKSLINISLIGLFASAWLASYYPAFSGRIAIIAVLGSTVIAVCTSLASSKHSAEVVHHALEQAAIQNTTIVDAASNTGQTHDVPVADSDEWKRLLEHWISNSHSELQDDAFSKAIIEKAMRSARVHKESKSVNIGIVNLVLWNDSASIKLQEQRGKRERRQDSKIDMVLRPEASLYGSHASIT